MLCKLIKKFALFVFWNCLDEDERQRNIKEHHFSKLKAEQVVDIENNQIELKNNITILRNRLNNVKNKIENDVCKSEILFDIEEMLKDNNNV